MLKQTHFAVYVDDFDGFVADLRKRDIDFWSWAEKHGEVTGRPDGFRQIYVADPDGYRVEVNDHSREVACSQRGFPNSTSATCG